MTLPTEIVADTPLVYYRLGETSGTAATDASGNARAGFYQNVTLNQASLVAGDSDPSAQFGGLTTTMLFPAVYGSWQDRPGSFSIFARIRPAFPGTLYQAIASRFDQGLGSSQFVFRVENANRKLSLYIFRGGGIGPVAVGATTLVAGTDYSVHGTWDGTTAKVYVNGVLDGSATSAGAAHSSTVPLVFGNRYTSSFSAGAGDIDSKWNGLLDEVAYFSQALTAARCLVHHTAATTVVAAPGVPTALTVTATAKTSLELTWSAPATGGTVDYYETRRDGGAAGTHTSPYVFTGLSAGTSYTLSVRAVGPGGTSAWADLVADTLPPTPGGYYRATLEIGDHSWTVERGDAPAYGPLLPVRLGWEIPEGDYFPAQASLQTLNLMVQTADASDLADVVKGTFITFALYVDNDPDVDPWQWFSGIVTQLDGTTVPGIHDPAALDYRVTVYAADTTAILADRVVGYANDWPVESISDRVSRICSEAAVGYSEFPGGGGGTGLEGWLPARDKGSPVTALDAVRGALRDAAEEYDGDVPDTYYGRFVFHHDRDSGDVYVSSFRRRVLPGATVTLDGGKVRADGSWSKQPGPHASAWGIVDDTTFGTPDGSVPFYVTTGLLDYFGDPPGSELNYTATTRDNLGNSLLPDGSVGLDGWSSRLLRYEAHLDPDPVALWASWTGASGLMSSAWTGINYAQVIPVVVAPIGPELEVNAVDYLAGTLCAAAVVIPRGGDYYVEFRLRAELLPGTDLP